MSIFIECPLYTLCVHLSKAVSIFYTKKFRWVKNLKWDSKPVQTQDRLGHTAQEKVSAQVQALKKTGC